MIHDIRQVFLANLEKLEWMDDVTKERAKDKVRSSEPLTPCGAKLEFTHKYFKRLSA